MKTIRTHFFTQNICGLCDNQCCSNKKTGMKVPNMSNEITMKLEKVDDGVHVEYTCNGFKNNI